jgi:hypothetical protein
VWAVAVVVFGLIGEEDVRGITDKRLSLCTSLKLPDDNSLRGQHVAI